MLLGGRISARRDGAPTLKRADVLQAIPVFARTVEAQRWIARVPA